MESTLNTQLVLATTLWDKVCQWLFCSEEFNFGIIALFEQRLRKQLRSVQKCTVLSIDQNNISCEMCI